MNASPEFPDFARIDRLLGRIGNPSDPAEVHGLLCGIYCLRGDIGRDVWMLQVLGDGYQEASREEAAVLLELFEATTRQFNDADLGLSLLLPDDDEPLSARADSLGEWCQGFMAGLGLGGIESHQGLSAEVQEFLRDLLEISRLEFDTDEADEADETAYAEIVEYVRMGILLVNEELRRRPQEPAGPGSSRIH